MTDNGIDSAFLRNLKGGFTASGLNYPECIVTKKPLCGVYFTRIRAVTMINDNGEMKPYKHMVPPHLGCATTEAVKATEFISATIIKSLKGRWMGMPVIVEMDMGYMPDPTNVMRLPPPKGTKETV